MSLSPTNVSLDREARRKLYETKTLRWDFCGHKLKGMYVDLYYESCCGFGFILIACSVLVYKIDVLIVYTIKMCTDTLVSY